MTMTEPPCPPDRCYGCWSNHPRQGGFEADIQDLRTGRRYCHEHAAAFITWELDGCPEPDEFDYPEWIDPTGQDITAAADRRLITELAKHPTNTETEQTT